MCGIVAYVGSKQAHALLLEGLKRLEYRGYDSAGLAWIDAGKLHVAKSRGRISVLEQKLSDAAGGVLRSTPHVASQDTYIGIAHTRWATHGQPNETNAHPHSDAAGKIALVHNGII